MEIMRLVVTGPVGAGKSTLIRTISEIEVVDTDRTATDETKELKQKTTVAFDFGRLQFNPNMALHLYGTPGQSRFDFMWDILIRKAHGYMLLVAAHRPSEFIQAKRIISFMNQRKKVPMIICLTHTDCQGAWNQDSISLALGYKNPHQRPTMVSINPTHGGSSAKGIIALVQEFVKFSSVAA